MEEKEIWKDVDGYEGLYQVSNLGNIRSVDRVVHGFHCFIKFKGKDLKLRHDKDGYLVVHFRDAEHNRNCLLKVHRLVALTFIPNNDLFRDSIDHINGKRDDNRVVNLRWCTISENANFQNAKINRSKSIKESYNKYPNLRKQRGLIFSMVRRGTYNNKK